MPLVIIDGITNRLTPLVYSRELKNNYTPMPLGSTNGIIDRLSPSGYSKELEKNYTLIPLTITEGFTNELKCVSDIQGVFGRFRVKLKF